MELKIIELEISNNKKIKAFRRVLNGENMNVAGDVSQGKTTAISALWEILSKKSDSLTHGAKKGFIRIKLGEYESERVIVAERKNTEKTSSVSIYWEDDKSKITISDFKEMLSSLSINPHKLMDLKPTEFVKTLARSANLDVDLDELDSEISGLEELRLDYSRDIDRLNPGVEPEKVDKVDVSELMSKLKAAQELDTENLGFKEELDQVKGYQETNNDEISDLHGRIAELVDLNEIAEKRQKELSDIVADQTDMDPVIVELQAKISKSQDVNEAHNRHQNWVERKEDQKKVSESHEIANNEIKRLREDKKKALDGAKWPITGLVIKDGVVLFNGCELSNLGTSEQLLVTSAIAINDINNHAIKVVRLDGIEAMSKAHFDQLTKLFNDKGIQVLSTRVSRGDIEDGEIQIVEGKLN